MTRIILLLAAVLAFMSQASYALEATGATTDDGKRVVLFPDGTWVYKPGSADRKKSPPRQSEQLGSVIDGGDGAYTVRYDENKWQQIQQLSEVAEYSLQHKTGDAYAMLIFEDAELTLDQLKQAVLDNTKRVASDVRVVHHRRVYKNGREIMVLKYKAKIDDLALTYYGYYASGKWGTLQFLSWSTTADFERMEGDLFELLNGLRLN